MTFIKQNTPLPYQWQSTFDSFIDAGTSASTKRAYSRDANYFWSWVKLHLDQDESYPTTVDSILAFCVYHVAPESPRPLKVKTLRRYLAMLSVAHALHGLDSPTKNPKVKLLLRRIKSAKKEQSIGKAPITKDILDDMVNTCNASLGGCRDKALLLLAFYGGGRRRQELSDMRADDLTITPEGYLLNIVKSKTDQQADGLTVPLTGETALAVKTWLLQSGIREGKLFRGLKPGNTLHKGITGKAINNMVKRRIKKIGLNEKHFGAHSLRAGFMTTMTQNGMSIHEAMLYSGHKDIKTAQHYVRLPELK